jgi:hypothetical protein
MVSTTSNKEGFMNQVVTGHGVVEVGSIIVTHGRVAIVDEINLNAPKNPIQYKFKTDHQGYICGSEAIQAVLGKGDIDQFNEAKAASPQAPKNEGVEALFGAMTGVKVGTPMQIRSRGGLETVTYTGWKQSRPKYPISFTRNDKPMKGPLSIVVKVTRDGELVPLHAEGVSSQVLKRTC